MTIRLIPEAAFAALIALTELVDVGGPGRLVLYGGARPQLDQPITTQTEIVSFTLPATAFAAPVIHPVLGVTAFLNAVAPTPAEASGNVTFYRLYDGNGDVLLDGAVSTAGGSGDLIVNTTSALQGVLVAVVAFSITLPT